MIKRLWQIAAVGLSLSGLRTALYFAGAVVAVVLIFLARYVALVRSAERGRQTRRTLEAQEHANEIVRQQRGAAVNRPDRDGLERVLERHRF